MPNPPCCPFCGKVMTFNSGTPYAIAWECSNDNIKAMLVFGEKLKYLFPTGGWYECIS